MPEPRAEQAQAWAGALDELEARLAGLAVPREGSPVAGWRPPGIDGPIPAELVDRARALLAAQERAADDLRAALADTSRHLTALKSIPSRIPRSTSVYLDVTG